MAAHIRIAVLHEHRLPGLQFLCFPTTEPTKSQRTVRAPQTAIFPLMFRGAGYRSPTPTICGNGLLAKNAKRRHGFCSEIICFSNILSAAQHEHRLNDLQVPLAPGYWNITRPHQEAMSASIFDSTQFLYISSNCGSESSSRISSCPCISEVSNVTDAEPFCLQTRLS